MSRRRSISTEISTDDKVAELAAYGPLPLLLYTWAIPHADDWGRMTGEARQFKLTVCPALDVTAAEVDAALEQIAAAGLWERYEVDGRRYLAFPVAAWFRYQSYISKAKREEDKSQFPPPPSWSEHHSSPDNTEERRRTPKNPSSPSPSPSPSNAAADSAHAREDAPLVEPSAEEKSLALMRRHFPTWFTAGRYYETLLSDVDDLGWELVLVAIERTLAAGKTDIRYLLGITRRWIEAGITSVADMEIHEARVKAEREQTAQRRARSPTREAREIHPIDEFDWSQFRDDGG